MTTRPLFAQTLATFGPVHQIEPLAALEVPGVAHPSEVYRTLLDRISDGVYFVDRDRRITFWNRGAEAISGYSAEEVLGRRCAEGVLRHISPAGRPLCERGCPLAAVMRDGRPRDSDVFLHHKAGHRVPVTVSADAITGPGGTIVGSVEVFSPRVTAGSAMGARSADDTLDPVSGLPPRRCGERQLASLSAAVREGEGTLGVMFIDADHFKGINDAHGHGTGDQVLRMLGQSLAHGLRRDDLPIRWGGEEFLALLPGIESGEMAEVAERVRMLVENSWIATPHGPVGATVSIGATMASRQDTAEQVVDRADRLMYRAKQSGRNQVTSDIGSPRTRRDRPVASPGRGAA